LTAITGQVERISDMNHQVATATEEQSAVTEEINRNVQGISDLARATAGRSGLVGRTVRRCSGWRMIWRGRWVGSNSVDVLTVVTPFAGKPAPTGVCVLNTGFVNNRDSCGSWLASEWMSATAQG
jgi:hypothetical protein